MMASDHYSEEGFRVLTSAAFDFVFNNELKRAVRSQNFLTLVHVEPVLLRTPSTNGERDEAMHEAVHEVARLIGRDVRETDLLSLTVYGRLSLVLLDADLQSSLAVIDRLMARLSHYSFRIPLTIGVGAACCPTDGADADTLTHAAESRPLQIHRDDRGTATKAQ